jgi:S-formylglutathione hydrolase FrmB
MPVESDRSPRVDRRDTLRWGKRLFAVLAAIACSSSLSAQWITAPVSAPGVEQRIFESETAGTAVSCHVYRPPAYEEHADRCFPVLYWLHGSGAATASIPPLSAWFDAAIAAGHIPPMLVVFANGWAYRMWCDSFDGQFPMETIFVDELMPFIDATYRTVPRQEGRILEGFSMGGQGTARIGLRRPDLFAGVSILGAGPLQEDFLDAPPGSDLSWKLRLQIYQAVWGSDPSYYTAEHPRTIAEANVEAIVQSGVAIRQAVGTDDFLHAMNVDFHSHLEALGIPHAWIEAPGVAHSTPDLFEALGPGNWDFYRGLFDGLGRVPADLDRSGTVDGADLSLLLAAWGACGSRCDPDLDASGTVDGADLAAMLAAWGSSGG